MKCKYCEKTIWFWQKKIILFGKPMHDLCMGQRLNKIAETAKIFDAHIHQQILNKE